MSQTDTVEGERPRDGTAPHAYDLAVDVRDRIRAEEIFRQEVHDDIQRTRKAKPSLLDTLNTPIVIWALSTLVVGTVSLLYTQWIAASDASAVSTRQQLIVMDEVEFRARQTNSALKAPFALGEALLSEIATDADIALRSVTDYVAGVGGAAVALRLGGLTAFADGRETSTVWIGTAGYGVRHLPFGRPFKNPDLQHQSVVDLAAEHHRLRAGNGEPARDPQVRYLEEQLERLARSVPHDALTRIEAGARTPNVAISPDQAKLLEPDIQSVQSWLVQAQRGWGTLHEYLLQRALIGP